MQMPLSFGKWRDIFRDSFPDLDTYASIYKDLHQHPELPCQESRTAAVVANHLEILGYKVLTGQTVLIRSELDALPMKETTGLSYASQVQQVDADGCTKPVMHGCGHDMHMASLLGAADLLQKVKDTWHGTLVCIFQPNEERLLGAQSMIDDGLFEKIPLPDILLGQHAVATKAGTIGTRPGRVLAFLDSLDVRIYGKGTHSSTPSYGIDPILMGCCIISRLQMVVAREIDSGEPCVVACGSFHGGLDASIIPEHADFKVDIRSFKKEVQVTAVAAVKRIIEGECKAAGSPKSPRILTSASCPPIDNDEEATAKFTRALNIYYGNEAPEKVLLMDLDITADDFVLLGHPPGEKPIPYVYWNYGVTPRKEYEQAAKDGTIRDLPVNHNPRFAPEILPSLRAGIEGLAIASVVFFERRQL